MKRNLYFTLFFLCLALTIVGCGLLESNPASSGIVNDAALPAGNASVQMKMVFPHSGEGNPMPSIRANAPAVVTFKLVLGNPGNSNRPNDILVKKINVAADGSANATFSGIPLHPVVGQVSILNGNYQGYASFHGALDLKDGDNTLEVAPTGSRMPQDILAHAALSTFDSGELMGNTNTGLIQLINAQVSGLDLNSPSVYSEAINKAIEVVRPSSQTYFAISADKKSLLGRASNATVWTKTTATLFSSADLWDSTVNDMSIKSVLRQNIGGIGYVAWKHDSQPTFAIGAITDSGTKKHFVKNPGLCEQMLVLPDASIIIGGINENKGQPVLFRWSAKENGATYSTTGDSETGLAWSKYFPSHSANATVKGIQFGGDQTLLVTIDKPIKVYRVSLAGVVENPTPTTPNSFPSVALTAPVANAAFEKGKVVSFAASASDSDGSIDNIKFYAGTTRIFTDNTSPYTATYNSLETGSYVVKAIATDDKGAQTVSFPVNITVTGPVIASPTYCNAIMGDAENTIRWGSVKDAVTYNVYFAKSSGVSKSSTKIVNVTSPFTHESLINGSTYYYIVTAVDAVSESEASAETSATPLAPKSGTTAVSIGASAEMEFVKINKGSFRMGQEDGEDDEKPVRTVELTKDFYMGKFEVTQSQYMAVIGGINPSHHTSANSYADNSNQPIESVTWYDAIRFCNALSISQNRTPCYTNSYGGSDITNTNSGSINSVSCSWTANGYRLPTEAEWEYACHGKKADKYSWGNASDTNTLRINSWCAYNAHSERGVWVEPHAEKSGTQPVGGKPENGWGLHDMHGNVSEWCWDGYNGLYYAESNNTVDPTGNATSLRPVVKGGSFQSIDRDLRIAIRSYAPSRSNNYTGLGFRIMRPIQ